MKNKYEFETEVYLKVSQHKLRTRKRAAAFTAFSLVAVLTFSGAAVSLSNRLRNSNEMTGEIEVTTYSGSSAIGTSSCAIIAHVVNSNPVFDVVYSDTNSATVAITENNQYIIRNNSTLQISVSNAQALNSATLKSITAVVNGNAYTGSLNGSIGVINVGVVNVSYDTEVTVKLTDSRGNAGQKKITVLVYDWSLPSAIIKLNRKSNYYSESILNVNANYASIGGKNEVTIKYRTKKVANSTYIITPYNVDIMGDLIDELENNGMFM